MLHHPIPTLHTDISTVPPLHSLYVLIQGVVSGETMAVGMARLGQPTQQV